MGDQPIWKVNSRGGLSPGATEAVLDEVEQRLAVRLPAGLRDAYRQQNGGYLSRGCFGGGSIESMQDAFYLENDPLEQVEEFRSLSEASAEGWDIQTEGLDDLIVIMQGGPRFWCLDYRQCGGLDEPSLTYLNAEMEEEVPVAPSWSAFCEGLTEIDRSKREEE